MTESNAALAERPSDEQRQAPAARRRIVDADAHLDPPHEMWLDYLPAHLRQFAPTIEHGPDHDFIVFEGKKRPLRLTGNQAGRQGKDFKMLGRIEDMRQVWFPATRLADMDTDGIETAIMFGGGPLGSTSSELYIASFDAYNRWLWDYCGADRKRLVGVAYLPARDVEESVAMLRAVAKMGFRSVNMPAFPQASDGITTSAKIEALATGQVAALTGDPSAGKSYADGSWDPFWAAAQELDITITVHLGGRIPRFGQKEHFLPDMVMSKLAMAEPIAVLTFGGVFQRFPGLRYVTVESGVGWMAWMAEYMDRTWEKQRFWMDSPLTDYPSFYMDRNVYGSFINDRLGILCRNEKGGKNIMWSSDYPHSETTFPHSHDVIARDFVDIPEADVREIIAERARRVYQTG